MKIKLSLAVFFLLNIAVQSLSQFCLGSMLGESRLLAEVLSQDASTVTLKSYKRKLIFNKVDLDYPGLRVGQRISISSSKLALEKKTRDR